MRAFHEIVIYPEGMIVLHRQYNNSDIQAHWHKEMEIIFISRGTAEFNIAGESVSAREGDFLVCNSEEVHYCDQHAAYCIFDAILFDPAVLWKTTNVIDLKSHFCPQSNAKLNHLDRYWKKLISDVDNGQFRFGEYYHPILAGEMQSFLYRLILAFPEDAALCRKETKKSSQIQEMQKAFDYVEQNYYEELTLRELAKHVGFSETYLSKLFIQYAGVGFRKYLNMVRVYQAQKLLSGNDVKMIDVAMKCGFTNVRSFNRSFLQVAGCTPSEWMKNPDRFQKTEFYRSTLYLKIKNELEASAGDQNTEV